jgi:hypothetical protein
MIYAYCVGDWNCNAGSGFKARSTFNGNLIEEMTAGNPGSYAATGSANKGWSMQLVAVKKRRNVMRRALTGKRGSYSVWTNGGDSLLLFHVSGPEYQMK